MSIGPPSNRWFLPLFLGFLLVVLVGRLTLKVPWYQQSPLGSHHEEHGYGNRLADMCTAESDYKHQNNRFGVLMRNIVATDHASASHLYDGEFKFVTDGCSRDQVTTSYGFKYEPASPGSPCLWGNTPPLKLLPVAALARALGVTTIIESGRRGGASALAYHQLGFHVISVEFEPIAEVEHALRQLAPSIELVNGDAMVEVPRILDRLSPGEAVGVVIDGPKLQPQYDLWAAIKSKVRFGALDDVNSTPGKYRRHQKNIMKTYHPYWSTSDDAYMNSQAPKDLRWADARAADLGLMHDFAKVILGVSSKDNCLRQSECSTKLGMAFLLGDMACKLPWPFCVALFDFLHALRPCAGPASYSSHFNPRVAPPRMSTETSKEAIKRPQVVFLPSACTTPCRSEVSNKSPDLNFAEKCLPLPSASAPTSPRGRISGLGKRFGVRVTLRDTFLQFEPERRQQLGGSREKGEHSGTIHG
ncbi:hypothetical protein FOZ63_027845, partial [Perkinsus olseni]